MVGWFGSSRNKTGQAVAEVAAAQLLASIDLFVYVRALPRTAIDQLVGGTPVGQIATVVLTRCLVEHAWNDQAPNAPPTPAQLRTALVASWGMFAPATRAALDNCYRDIAQRRLDAPSRLVLAQLEHWCEAAVGNHFADGRPVRTGWLTYVLGRATDNASLADSALADFPVVA